MKSPLALVALFLCISAPAQARWERIHSFGLPMSLVYFVTPNVGFAGSGWVTTPARAVIFKTTDGGSTWAECPSPQLGQGVIGSISIKGNVGYASVKVSRNTQQDISIWKTTDGGDTWFDFSPEDVREAVNVMDVGNALVLSTWAGGGWVNLTPSLVWNNTLPSRDQVRPRSNGLASNGTDVVVTDFNDREWFSSDGGVQWERANNIPEAWSVYNLEGTRWFYTASEGDDNDVPNNPAREIYRSQDGGASWQSIFRFPNPRMTFTGHIDGKGSSLYIQSAISIGLGMFRSDDLGLSWKSIGGPSGNRDTRFAVQGCGETIYALNTIGELFKSIDAGDGSFIANGFFLGQPLGGYVGDTVDIPLYVRDVPAGVTINGTRLQLNVNRDLLDNWSTTNGTVTLNGNTLDLDLTFTPPLTDTFTRTWPVAVLRAKNYLTTETTLPLELITIDIQATKLTEPCGVSQVQYVQLPSCGDATIRGLMLKEAEGIVRITPSPVITTATIELKDAKDATLVVYDMVGREVPDCVSGDQLNAGRLPAGSYVLVLTKAGKVLDRKSFLVHH